MTKGYFLRSKNNYERFLAIFILIAFLITTFSYEADSRRRRSYKPEKTREQAIKIIRMNSEELCHLAGLDPLIQSEEMSKELEEQSELFDVEEEAEDIEELTDDTTNVQVCIPDSISVDEAMTEVVETVEAVIDAEEEYEDEEIAMDMETFRTIWLDYVDDGEGYDYTEGGISKQELMGQIMDWLGTPYRFGGNSRRAIDCSAFVQKIFLASSDIMLPRTARYQYKVGAKISRDNLEFGDLIFFHTYTYRFPSHVGIYLGDDLFAHASSRYGVTISSLNGRYYSKRFIAGKRLMLRDINRYSIHKDNEEITQ